MNRINPETEKRMVEMYKNGISMCKLAKEFSVSSGTVYLHLKRFVPKNKRQERQYKKPLLPKMKQNSLGNCIERECHQLKLEGNLM